MNPYDIVQEFEKRLAEYTESAEAVAVDCCTNAIFLCCKYLQVKKVTIPKRTFVSVPCAIINAGGTVEFDDQSWSGRYQLKPYRIYDSCLMFHKYMHLPNTFECLSFSANKFIPIGKGGMILTDDSEAAAWFRRARNSGRHERVDHNNDTFDMIGWNMYMTPEQAARGLTLMQFVKDCYPNREVQYQDLSQYKVFHANPSLHDILQ